VSAKKHRAVRSAVCPMCKHLPSIVVSIAQAFCGTSTCPVWCWDMRDTPEEFRRTAVSVDLSPPGA
jgi:hypothetical protein